MFSCKHEADLVAKRFLWSSRNVTTIDLSPPGVRIVETWDQGCDGGLTGAGGPNQRRHFTGIDPEIHIFQRSGVSGQ